MVGQQRCRAQHGGDPVQQSRVALKQRQKLHAGGLAGQECVEPVEHRVRLRLSGERGQDARQHLGQQIAARSDRSARTWPGLPATHRDDDALRICEAKRFQCRVRGGGRRVDAAEIQLRPGCAGRQRLRHEFENLRVARADLAEMAQQLGGEAGRVGDSP